MRRLPILLTVLAATALLAGCLDSKETFTLEADGSGTLEQTYVIDLKARSELLQTAALLYGGQSDPETVAGVMDANPVATGWLEDLANHTPGYTIDKVEEVTEDRKRTTTVKATFKNLEAAAKAGAFFTSAVTLERTTPEKNWRLVCRDAWEGSSEASFGELGGDTAVALLQGFEPQLKGLKIRRTFVFPTKVLETSGSLAEDGRTVTWTVDYAKLLEGKNLVLTVVFAQSPTLKLETFRYRPDWDALLKRCIEAPPKEERVPTTPPETPDGEGEGAEGEKEDGDAEGEEPEGG